MRAAADRKTPSPATLLLMTCLVTAVLYLFSTDIKIFADDFASWNTAHSFSRWSDLFALTYNPEFYRPLELMLIRINLAVMGFDTTLHHLVALMGHLLTVLAVYFLTRRMGLSPPTGIAASLVFGLSNANAFAVLGNDSASLIYSGLCGLTALILLLPGHPPGLRDAVAAGGMLMLSVLWKDSGVAYFAAAGLLVVMRPGPERKLGRLVVLLAPLALALGIYMLARHAAGITGPEFQADGRYHFWLGWNVPRNLLYLSTAMLTPIGTTILLLHRTNTPFLVLCIATLIALGSYLVAGMVMYARRDDDHRRRLMLPAFLGMTLFLPDCLLNRVSELYAYKPNALFSILLAVGIVEIYGWASSKGSIWRLMFIGFFAVFLMCNVFSVKHKERLMRANGERAERMIRQIKLQVPLVPPGTPIVVSNLDPGPGITYSVFYIHGVWVLGAGNFYESLYGNELVGYRYVPPQMLPATLAGLTETTLVITSNRGKVSARLLP